MDMPTVLFSEMIPKSDWEQDFNRWYDREHIPNRMNTAGFQCARRYREIDGDKYLAVYEMDSPDVLKSPEYQLIKNHPSEETKWMLANISGFTRYTGNEISNQVNPRHTGNPYEAPILYPVMFEVPAAREQEFNDWYTQDHVPTLLKNPDWLACRRYRIFSGEPENWTHLALHYLANPEVLQCAERVEARNSPWRNKLAQESWFNGKYMMFQLLHKFTSTHNH
jgi:hypothetical protein